MNDTGWRESAQQAQQAIVAALGASEPEAAVAELSRGSECLEEALREAMADAVLDGSSMRRVAEITGMAPNSVPPRLARSKLLGRYAGDGNITAQSIAVARHEAASGSPSMTFTPRRKDAQ
ncbi:MAG: hypothetical protein WCF12_09040 [Propionicimonas sp.]